jgi:Na+/melibiose symporter-like transporter
MTFYITIILFIVSSGIYLLFVTPLAVMGLLGFDSPNANPIKIWSYVFMAGFAYPIISCLAILAMFYKKFRITENNQKKTRRPRKILKANCK